MVTENEMIFYQKNGNYNLGIFFVSIEGNGINRKLFAGKLIFIKSPVLRIHAINKSQ
jgi:hypothetical protein